MMQTITNVGLIALGTRRCIRTLWSMPLLPAGRCRLTTSSAAEMLCARAQGCLRICVPPHPQLAAQVLSDEVIAFCTLVMDIVHR